jgi:integrase/recombinase XerD
LILQQRKPIMAEIFRPAYHVDPATGKRVNAATPGAVRKKSPTWWIRYYTPDGKRHKVKGYPDKKATENKAAELERRGIRIDAGIVDPSDVHAKTPLAEHAEDFRRYLAAKQNTADYVALSFARLTAILDGCRFTKIGDVQASAVVEYLGTLRNEGKSVKTANDYLAAVKGFTRWLWRDKRSVFDPLAGLSKFANSGDIRHARRDLSPDELGLLLAAAMESKKSIRCLAGRDRYFLYLTAAATGFRASELASMTPDSFNLDGDAPTATVQASCTKNRKLAVQPLPLDVAQTLLDYLADKPAGAALWPGKWRRKAVFMIRADLKEARRKWLSGFQDARQRAEAEQSDVLAYRDSEGRYADFHSLRHGYITMIGKAGVSPREHQDLARHSTYAMTSRYTHSRFYDLAAAVQALPIPTAAARQESQTLAATGTDGRQISLGPFLGPQPAISADFGGQTRTEATQAGNEENPGKIAVFASFPGSAQQGRNVEAPGIEPGSRRTSASASTCVACLAWSAEPTAFAHGHPGKQSFPQAIRQCFLAGAASGATGLATDPGPSDPDLMTRQAASQAKATAQGSRY